MKDILVGNSSFENLIKGKYIYVDKTRYFYELIKKEGMYCFLSRPRRFGKTLTVDTIEQIFKGRRELFKGLYIDSTDYDWKEYPVIHIDFGLCGAKNAENLAAWINDKLDDTASAYGLIPAQAAYYTKFERLITALSQREKVVILIDEYDKLLSSNIYNPEVEEVRDVLKGFFEVIKASYNHLRFVFITGVTKYAKLSVFSSMNNLFDITMDEPYSTMLGFTQEEVERYFSDYIQEGCHKAGMTREEYLEKLKARYDGYCFSPLSEERVYNPVSVSTFFIKGGVLFDNYWAETGGTKLLMDIAKKVKFNVAEDLEKPVSRSKISSFDILEMTTGNVTPLKYKSLLFQSGYLTITGVEKNGRDIYLGFPNEEVEETFSLRLLEVYGGEETEENFDYDDLLDQFRSGNTEGVIDNLYSVYASIPYREGQKQMEADWQGMFYAMMTVIHARINLEVMTNKGRIDAVVRTEDHIYIIEFKRDKSAGEALKQIKDRGYYESYMAWSNKEEHKIHLLGINFSTEKRNIDDWKEEIVK